MNDLTLTRHNPFLSRVTNGSNCTTLRGDDAVEHFIRESLSENTRQAYRADLAHFTVWGGTLPASPETVARYLAENAEILAPATLSRRVATRQAYRSDLAHFMDWGGVLPASPKLVAQYLANHAEVLAPAISLLPIDLHQEREPGLALDNGGDVAVLRSANEITFPMPRNCAVVDASRSFPDGYSFDNLLP